MRLGYTGQKLNNSYRTVNQNQILDRVFIKAFRSKNITLKILKDCWISKN